MFDLIHFYQISMRMLSPNPFVEIVALCNCLCSCAHQRGSIEVTRMYCGRCVTNRTIDACMLVARCNTNHTIDACMEGDDHIEASGR